MRRIHDATKIRPEVFTRAAEIVESGQQEYTCSVLPNGAYFFLEEEDLWEDFHSSAPSPYRGDCFSGIPEGPRRQMVRAQCLREVELNMRAQGFCE